MMQTRRISFSYNDAILLFSFAYSSTDIVREWSEFQKCQKPIQLWLLVSYLGMVAFRLSHYVGQYCSEEGEDFLLYFRQRAVPPRLVLYFTWFVLLPFFAGWTVLGTVWLVEVMRDSPNCLPSGTHPWFVIFWQILCYIWILIYCIFIGIAIVLERRASRAESDLRAIETEDILLRWGRLRVSGDGVVSLGNPDGGFGMTPSQIEVLPSIIVDDESKIPMCGDHCSICLSGFKCGDHVRKLPACGHYFHQSCIDIWLLRRADCPLCKGIVDAAEKAKMGCGAKMV